MAYLSKGLKKWTTWDEAELALLKTVHESTAAEESADNFWRVVRRGMKSTRTLAGLKTRAKKEGLSAKIHRTPMTTH